MIWETCEEINKNLAIRFKKLRKRKGLTQEELSIKSNVSYGSIKRFETTGNISLLSLTKLCSALHLESEINNLFSAPSYESIEEVINDK